MALLVGEMLVPHVILITQGSCTSAGRSVYGTIWEAVNIPHQACALHFDDLDRHGKAVCRHV